MTLHETVIYSDTVHTQVEWQDAADPAKGFQYLYLTDADHARLTKAAARPTFQVREMISALNLFSTHSCPSSRWFGRHLHDVYTMKVEDS